MKRGMITDEIKQKSIELLGYEVSQQELRLIPYVMYCLVNDDNIDMRKVNNAEREILMKWKEKGFIDSPSSDLAMSKEFYDAANQFIFIGYVKAIGRNK